MANFTHDLNNKNKNFVQTKNVTTEFSIMTNDGSLKTFRHNPLTRSVCADKSSCLAQLYNTFQGKVIFRVVYAVKLS